MIVDELKLHIQVWLINLLYFDISLCMLLPFYMYVYAHGSYFDYYKLL